MISIGQYAPVQDAINGVASDGYPAFKEVETYFSQLLHGKSEAPVSARVFLKLEDYQKFIRSIGGKCSVRLQDTDWRYWINYTFGEESIARSATLINHTGEVAGIYTSFAITLSGEKNFDRFVKSNKITLIQEGASQNSRYAVYTSKNSPKCLRLVVEAKANVLRSLQDSPVVIDDEESETNLF